MSKLIVVLAVLFAVFELLPAQSASAETTALACATQTFNPPAPQYSNQLITIDTPGDLFPSTYGGAVWFEPHFCNPLWTVTTNGLPYWQYLIQTRIDTPTDIEGHYGVCQEGRNCVRIFDGNFGTTGWLGDTHAWNCLNYPNNICSTVNTFLNNTYLGANASYGSGFWRGTTLCHEIGHSIGLAYHRTTAPSDSCMAAGFAPTVIQLNAADRGYVNGMY